MDCERKGTGEGVGAGAGATKKLLRWFGGASRSAKPSGLMMLVGEVLPEALEEFEDIEPVESEFRSVGASYDSMFVVDNSAIGAEILFFEIECRFEPSFKVFSPFRELFFVMLRLSAMVPVS